MKFTLMRIGIMIKQYLYKLILKYSNYAYSFDANLIIDLGFTGH